MHAALCPESPSLAARLVLASCYLYYELDQNILSDHQYDRLTELVAERWSEIEPLRRWQLGKPEAILATGSHVKLTWYNVFGAYSWFRAATGGLPAPSYPHPETLTKFSKKHGVYWGSVHLK